MFKNKKRGPEIVLNHFKTKYKEFSSFFKNFFKNKTRNPQDSFKLLEKEKNGAARPFKLLQKPGIRGLSRFFQTTSKMVLKILSN